MKTSAEAIKLLQQSLSSAKQAESVISDLIATHDYQDVATLITQAAVSLLESATALMQMQDEDAINSLDIAEDLLEEVWDIIDADTDDD